MLTDITPTAGQLYGAQIPAMTMNIANINKTVSNQNFSTHRQQQMLLYIPKSFYSNTFQQYLFTWQFC